MSTPRTSDLRRRYSLTRIPGIFFERSIVAAVGFFAVAGWLMFPHGEFSRAAAIEYHVAVDGRDDAPGTAAEPFRTIQRAADLAQPGDVVTVHEGIYRERVNPPRGGESDSKRITYQTAPGETVEIRGSEVVKNWVKVQDGVWKVTLPNSMFGDFNPYADLIHGDWFDPKGREHHTGAVYLDGNWLSEAAVLDDVLKPAGKYPLWFGRVDEENTTLWAQFKDADPNERTVEINVRRTVFYPDKPGRNYITVRGFVMRHAATPWAPPTAEQIGLIGTHWSKGWIIENNVVSHSRCSGITLGKYGDQWDNSSQNTAEGYVQTIHRALENGWNRETIGGHVVRNNVISDCEQTGICGSLGAVFSRIVGNHIHHIHFRRDFGGAEMAGIKIHAAIDMLIKNNLVHHAGRGIWLDWMAQGTRVSGNLCYDNTTDDLLMEVDHGPFLIDNNLFLSHVNLWDVSQGGAYSHNLMTGKVTCRPDKRQTPFHKAHSTALAGAADIKGGDNRFFNNIFVGVGKTPAVDAYARGKDLRTIGYGICVYDDREFPLQAGGNLYFHGAKPYANEANPAVLSNVNPNVKLVEEGKQVYLLFTFGQAPRSVKTALVTSELLGKAKIPGVGYENPDGSPLKIDRDYFGAPRDAEHPRPGPFEYLEVGPMKLNVWDSERVAR